MIYLDHNATTITHHDVKLLMCSLISQPLNPSSIHTEGRKARNLIDHARLQVANLLNINTKDYQVVFTGSGSEANNLVITNFKDADIFISATEHLSIIEYAKYMPNVKIITVTSNGIVNLEHLRRLLCESANPKKLVSVMLANNETGVIQPIREVAKIATEFGALTHSDCIQGIGKIAVSIPDLGVDFATISGHKFGGPLGAAALIMKSKQHFTPVILGGGQEKGIRAGTENVPAIAGLGLASEIVLNELYSRQKKMHDLQQKLEKDLPPEAKIVAKDALRLPNTLSIVVPNFDAQTQIIAFDLRGIYLSSGSACSSGKVGSSHVLKAMNIKDGEIKSAIRVSLSYHNSEHEIDSFIQNFKDIYKIRKIA